MNTIINTDRIKSEKPHRSPGQKRQLTLTVVISLIVIASVALIYFFLVPRKDTFILEEYSTATVQSQDLVITEQASGVVDIPVQMILLSPQAGYALDLSASLGQFIEKGEVLAELEVPDLDESIEDLISDIDDSRLSYEKLLLQHQMTLSEKEKMIEDLTEELEDADAEVIKYRTLVEINSAPQANLNEVIDKRDDTASALEDAKEELTYTRQIQQIDAAAAQSSLERQETKLQRLLDDKDETIIRSPMNGEIIDLEEALGIPGSLISANKQLFTIADPYSAVFNLEIAEEYAGLIELGGSVAVVVNDITVYGRITSIGKVAQTSSDGLGATVEVVVTPETSDGSFLLGSTAIGTFTLGVQEDCLTLPRGSYLTTGGQKYLYVIHGDQAVKTPVTFGEIEGNTIQILDGVEAGQTVIISGYQNFINYGEITLKTNNSSQSR